MPALDYTKIADLYDIYAQTAIDIPFFIEEARGCARVLELTCGTGRLSIPLVEAGVNLSCLDSSPDMLAILRKKLASRGLFAPIYEMDASDFVLSDRFDLIIIPFNAFSEISVPEAQIAALSTIQAHLTASGRLICTLHNPAARLRQVDGEIHPAGIFPFPDGNGVLFLSSIERFDPESHIVQGAQFYEVYTDRGFLQSKRFVDIRFYLHSIETFQALITPLGFQVLALYGDYARSEYHSETSPYMIWVLSKA